IWVADVTDDPRFRLQELARLGGLRGAFVVPVTCQAGVMGVLSFMSGRVREPDRRLLQSMQIIASQVGQFLQRKDAEARRAKHLGYQETLARFAAAALGKRAADELVAEATSTTHDALEGTMGVELATQAACAVVAIARGDAGALGRVLEKSGGALSEEECKFLDAAASVLSAGLRRIESESRLAFLAQFDALTGLPNRALLADRFAQMIVQARRRASLLGVLFIDLDHFKLVNDSLGHAGGDALLKEVAARLQGCVRAGDTVARISGDEFAVLLADLARAEDAALVAQKILDRLAEPVAVAGKETFVSASIGIAAFPADGADAETLLRAADAAMYRAKQAGRNAYQFFTPEIDQRTRARAQLGSELRRALERNEFELAYQPKISLRTGEACGAEALLRWRRPDGEVVSPAQFIPVLEETGLIVAVGEWVLTRACADLKAWQAAGLRVVPIAVNLSARQFRQSDLEARIRSIIEAAGVAPGLLELEITESQLMQDPEHAVRVLEALHAAGIGIAIDDFGTGYSSLSYLTRFPVSSLKIDRSFVADVLSDRADATIVRTVVDMAHSLGVTVVAEGVETEAQAAFLSALGCEQAQGFLFARPMPAAALAERIAARR
ncbi:MAG TPA: EAL domain-containing protein, partial [Burkholderiales bacterium]|nr:EAL domain-containing protein [Burkholderiales bacterium]